MSNWKLKKLDNIFLYILLLRFWGEHSHVNNVINALLCLCSCFYVQVFEVNYFEIFGNFCWDRGVGGWGVSYPIFFGFL